MNLKVTYPDIYPIRTTDTQPVRGMCRCPVGYVTGYEFYEN